MDQFPGGENPWRVKSEAEPVETEPVEIIEHEVVGDYIRLKVQKLDGSQVVGDVPHTPANVAQILTGTFDLLVK